MKIGHAWKYKTCTMESEDIQHHTWAIRTDRTIVLLLAPDHRANIISVRPDFVLEILSSELRESPFRVSLSHKYNTRKDIALPVCSELSLRLSPNRMKELMNERSRVPCVYEASGSGNGSVSMALEPRPIAPRQCVREGRRVGLVFASDRRVPRYREPSLCPLRLGLCNGLTIPPTYCPDGWWFPDSNADFLPPAPGSTHGNVLWIDFTGSGSLPFAPILRYSFIFVRPWSSE